jgi:hypothetical protein
MRFAGFEAKHIARPHSVRLSVHHHARRAGLEVKGFLDLAVAMSARTGEGSGYGLEAAPYLLRTFGPGR